MISILWNSATLNVKNFESCSTVDPKCISQDQIWSSSSALWTRKTAVMCNTGNSSENRSLKTSRRMMHRGNVNCSSCVHYWDTCQHYWRKFEQTDGISSNYPISILFQNIARKLVKGTYLNFCTKKENEKKKFWKKFWNNTNIAQKKK